MFYRSYNNCIKVNLYDILSEFDDTK